ncbi:MAG TPA: ABC transporter permease [Gemmatimonadaceae bacterium]|nr:ABC transporter permease [Gemmatimonadaceae bacterium]
MNLVESVRLGLRSLARAPGFSAMAVAILAIGIGLSTSVFAVADALLLRQLPVREQDRLVTLWGEKRDGSIDHWPLDLRSTEEFARESRAVQQVAYVAYEGAWPVAIRDGDRLTRLRRALVSGNFFTVLGTRPVIGRALRQDDNVVGAAPVAVISSAIWQSRFGGDPTVIGRRIVADEFNLAYTIVGVMPQGLEYPVGADFWAPYVPARLTAADDTTAYTALDIVGRLAPTASIENARNELTTHFSRDGTSAMSRELRGVAHELPEVVLGDARPAVLVFTAAAVLLLLIACMNVANLLLVRGLARTREIAIRLALGASRSRIVAQLVGENVVLALAGGVLGVGVSALAVRGFLWFAPADIPLLGRVRLDATVLAAAFVLTTVATLLFGIAPAFLSARANANEMLRSGARQSAGRGARRGREALVAAQVALAVLMLSAATLIGRSFVKLQREDLAFDASHLIVAELAIRYDRFTTPASQLPLVREVVEELRVTPGVQGVSPVVAVPFSGTGGWTGRARTEGQSAEDAAGNPMFNMDVVGPDYFTTFGLQARRGRVFTDEDRNGAEPVVVVSEGTARRYWPGADPVGKRLLTGATAADEFTVVGVVADTRYRSLRDAMASVYFPLAQSRFPFAPTRLAIRAAGAPADLVPTIRRVIDRTTPGVRLASAAPFESYMRGPLAQPRLNSMLLVTFAVVAVALAAMGLFGVMATTVRQRAHEFGVRMALGATPARIRTMVLGRGLAITCAGVSVGVIASLLATRALSALLYGVSAVDPLTFIGVAICLTIIALLATFIPARFGAHVDPASALRADG